jgi:sugar phosphate isomerase/epimerase
MGSADLVLSHYSVRSASFAERLRSASAAGYVGIGLTLAEYQRLHDQGHTDRELRTRLDEHGQRVVGFEALRGWASTGPMHEKCLQNLELLARSADTFGPPHHVQVIGPYEGDLARASEAFAWLCDRLAALGTRAALEYLPQMSNIPDVATAGQIVDGAGRANGGLCVDSWHHVRAGDSFADLARIPAGRVTSVQINDGPLAPIDPDYYTDCTSYRLVPGTGEFDLVGFVRTLDAMGVDVPFEVEVISLELDRLPPAAAAARMAEGTRAVLARAR